MGSHYPGMDFSIPTLEDVIEFCTNMYLGLDFPIKEDLFFKSHNNLWQAGKTTMDNPHESQWLRRSKVLGNRRSNPTKKHFPTKLKWEYNRLQRPNLFSTQSKCSSGLEIYCFREKIALEWNVMCDKLFY